MRTTGYRRILQSLTLCQATPTWEATQVICGLTQGQALRVAQRQLHRQNMKNSEGLLHMPSNPSEGYDFIFQNQSSFLFRN
jgi:hypothetical protein